MSNNDKIQVTVHQPFVLEDTAHVWMIISGEINVFYTEMDDEGNYLYALKYLYTLKKGDLLLSLIAKDTDEKIRLIVFSDNATLLPINKNEVLNIDHLYLKSRIDKWIMQTSSSLISTHSPRIFTSLDHFNNLVLNKDEVAFSAHRVHWVTLQKGEINIYGTGKKRLDADKDLIFPIPTPSRLWIKSLSSNTEVKVQNTRQILNDEINFLLSLKELEAHFYSLLKENLKDSEKEAIEYIEEKEKNEQDLLTKTLEGIKSVVGKVRSHSLENRNTTHHSKKTSLFKVCELIAQASGFSLEEPKHLDSYQNSVINQLTAIAKTSNIRFRKIILRGNWWKEENGHLLAFRKGETQPVALLQKKQHYVLIDPNTDEEREVNYSIAENLEPIGYMFFAGFEKKMTSIKDILSFAVKGIKNDARFLIVAALAGSLIGLLVPVLSGIMFDDIIPTADRSLHRDIFSIMLIMAFVTTGLQLVQGVLQMRVETKSSINLQAGVMDYILRLPVTFYKKYTAGDLTNRVLSINSIRQILSNTLITAALSGAFSFVNLILLFYYDSKLAWAGVLLGFIAVGFMITIGLLKLQHDRKISQNQGELQGFLFEFLSGISKIRITGAEKRIFSLWAEKFSRLKRLGFISGTYQNFVETFNSSYPLVTNIVFFSFIYYTVLHSDGSTVAMLSVGSFMAFITSFNKFLNDSLRLSMAMITSLNVIPLYERVKPIFEADTESSEQSSDPGELSGDIEMNSISFRYKEDQPLILKEVSFKIKQGEMVAFVGPSGSGKSTIMRLLLGFENPESGSIYYDGEAFDSMNKELVRRQIGVVLQNGALMSGSIFQNIVGNSELTLDDAWEAAKMSGLEEDIKQMPMEMHTVVSEGGGTFSGGQRQRLMIARAIAHKPRLLYMDEATSALDNRTQNTVSESLDKLQATRIVIAHRLSTVKNADRIYVLDKGQIVESGTYDELMLKNGMFTQLAKRQIA